MTDDASLTDFLDDGESDEGEDNVASETGEQAGAAASGGEATDQNASDESEDDAPDDGTATDTADDAPDDGTDPESEEARVPPATVESAASTAAWSPDGEPCDDCGSVAPYRWTGAEGLVCPDCKEW